MSYAFSNWSIDRKIRALELMDEYLKKHATATAYEAEWPKYGAHPHQKDKLREIAGDDEMFVNALFEFYVCLTTDISWLKI